MKKHTAIVIAVFASMIFLGGCSLTPSPTKTVDTFLQAVKTQDGEALADVYGAGELDLFDKVAESDENAEEEETDDELTKVYEEQIVPKMLDFDYELSNEQIDGDKATVDVTVKTYSLGDAFTAFFSDFVSQAFMLAFSDASDEQVDALATTILSGKIADLTEKTYEKTTTISLTKADGKWVVDPLETGSDAVDALTGGLVTAFKNMDNAASALGAEE